MISEETRDLSPQLMDEEGGRGGWRMEGGGDEGDDTEMRESDEGISYKKAVLLFITSAGGLLKLLNVSSGSFSRLLIFNLISYICL